MVQCVVYKNVSSLWLSDGCSKLWDQQHWTPTPQTSVMYMGWAGCSCQLTADLSVLWWLAVAARRRSLTTGRSVPDERADTACTVSEHGLATNAARWWQDMDMPDTVCWELCKNGWTDRFAIWVVESGGPKEAQVQLYSAGGASVPSWGHIGATWQIRLNHCLRRRCSLMWNYFDHLLLTYLACCTWHLWLQEMHQMTDEVAHDDCLTT